MLTANHNTEGEIVIDSFSIWSNLNIFFRFDQIEKQLLNMRPLKQKYTSGAFEGFKPHIPRHISL